MKNKMLLSLSTILAGARVFPLYLAGRGRELERLGAKDEEHLISYLCSPTQQRRGEQHGTPVKQQGKQKIKHVLKFIQF